MSRRRMLHFASLILVTLLCDATLPAQRIVQYSGWLPAPPLDIVVPDSDVIVRGTIRGVSRVFVEQDVVWTEYSVSTTRTLFQRTGTLPDGRLGAINEILFRIGGGTGTVEGELITAQNIHYPPGAFATGSDYILMLKNIIPLNFYSPTGGPYSVFRIDGDRVVLLKPSPYETRQLDGMSVDNFLRVIQSLLPHK